MNFERFYDIIFRNAFKMEKLDSFSFQLSIIFSPQKKNSNTQVQSIATQIDIWNISHWQTKYMNDISNFGKKQTLAQLNVIIRFIYLSENEFYLYA